MDVGPPLFTSNTTVSPRIGKVDGDEAFEIRHSDKQLLGCGAVR